MTTVIDALESYGPHPALVYYGPDGRQELSGHVLANWVIKSVNFLREECMLGDGDAVALAMPSHWKRTVLALAARSCGARVEVADHLDALSETDVTVLATDTPESPSASDAQTVLAVEAVSLALRFPRSLEALTIDWLQEVRGHSDLLIEPLADGLIPVAGRPGHGTGADASSRTRVALNEIDHDGYEALLSAFAAGHTVIAPAASLSAQARANEGLQNGDAS